MWWQNSLCRRWVLEYDECVRGKGVRPTLSKKAALGMTRNNICWYYFSSGDLGNTEYAFIVLIPRSVIRDQTIGQIDLFRNYLYFIGLCTKDNYVKNINKTYCLRDFQISRHKISVDGFTSWEYHSINPNSILRVNIIKKFF